jgi:hypothetical protein
MPVYEYQGQHYELADGLSDEQAKAKILAHLNKEPTISTGEAVGAGFLSSALGLSRFLGGDVAESQTRARKAEEEAAAQRPIATSAGKMIPSVIAAAPGLVAAAPITSAAGLGFGGSMALETALAGTPVGGGIGAEKYQQVLDVTGDKDLAMKAALSTGALNAVGIGMPASLGGRALSRIATGGTINTATSQADIAAQNAILSEHPELQQKQFDPADMALSFGFGGLFGALGPRSLGKADTQSAAVGKSINEMFTPEQAATERSKLVKQAYPVEPLPEQQFIEPHIFETGSGNEALAKAAAEQQGYADVQERINARNAQQEQEWAAQAARDINAERYTSRENAPTGYREHLEQQDAEALRQRQQLDSEMAQRAGSGEQGGLFEPHTNMHRAYEEVFAQTPEGIRPFTFTEFKETLENLAKEPGTAFHLPEDMKAAYQDYLNHPGGGQGDLFGAHEVLQATSHKTWGELSPQEKAKATRALNKLGPIRETLLERMSVKLDDTFEARQQALRDQGITAQEFYKCR